MILHIKKNQGIEHKGKEDMLPNGGVLEKESVVLMLEFLQKLDMKVKFYEIDNLILSYLNDNHPRINAGKKRPYKDSGYIKRNVHCFGRAVSSLFEKNDNKNEINLILFARDYCPRNRKPRPIIDGIH
ncbi:hypothetical protein TI05_03260 [Achromatium sp. WMS3]|nr:hypothetical protein TI05_03260 [Achromatium sp. WMS3]